LVVSLRRRRSARRIFDGIRAHAASSSSRSLRSVAERKVFLLLLLLMLMLMMMILSKLFTPWPFPKTERSLESSCDEDKRYASVRASWPLRSPSPG